MNLFQQLCTDFPDQVVEFHLQSGTVVRGTIHKSTLAPGFSCRIISLSGDDILILEKDVRSFDLLP